MHGSWRHDRRLTRNPGALVPKGAAKGATVVMSATQGCGQPISCRHHLAALFWPLGEDCPATTPSPHFIFQTHDFFARRAWISHLAHRGFHKSLMIFVHRSIRESLITERTRSLICYDVISLASSSRHLELLARTSQPHFSKI